ncbi:MAG: metalloregulator ArsR/SmtB family transcription factor [Pyrinomonadaceae bacterium]
MQESTLIELEKLFLALSDKTRLRLLALMADGEVPVGFLADKLGESQPKISRHLAYLRSAGLVSTRRDGKWVNYGIESQDDAAVTRVLDATLRSIMADDEPRNLPRQRGDEYRDYDNETEILPGIYIDDWRPAEMEIYLL